MTLEIRKPAELVPSYSLTGDLLAFMRCGLQYRYHNGSSLPPSRPVQMWFGEFIHGVMESAYRTWEATQPAFPWPCNPTPFNSPKPSRVPHDIGEIGDLVEATLTAAGKNPRSRHLRDSGYNRAEAAVNNIGPALFPLIRAAEQKVIGTRTLSSSAGSRASMYELHGIVDVLSSVDVAGTVGNFICDAVRAAVTDIPDGSEIIVDYKGSRRPAVNGSDGYWEHGDWQLQMYAWLRSQQPNAPRVVAGVLLYVSELAPTDEFVAHLKKEARDGETDVKPPAGSNDDYLLRTWRPGNAVPDFSLPFRLARVIRVVKIDPPSTAKACRQFDDVVVDIESKVSAEASAGRITDTWPANVHEETCVACDFRHFCPEYSEPDTAPSAP